MIWTYIHYVMNVGLGIHRFILSIIALKRHSRKARGLRLPVFRPVV